MNFKNKIVALVMSFVICFGTVSNSFCNDKERINNISPLFVDGGVISAPMLATVSALAVGTGIVLKNSDDIYDIGYAFYDYIKSHNEMTWEFVQNAFIAGHTLINDVVHVDSNFLDIVLGFFDSTFKDDFVNNDVNYLKGVGYLKKYSLRKSDVTNSYKYDTLGENIRIEYNNSNFTVYYNDTVVKSVSAGFYHDIYSYATINVFEGLLCLELYSHPNLKLTRYMFNPSVAGELVNLPYTGGYDKTKVEDKKVNDSLALPVPGDLNSLVGQTSDDFWTNDKDLVGSKPIVKPNVSNPSIDVTNDSFVGGATSNPSVPNDSIFSNIRDFIISLVVPSDTFWTDTFNGFRDNFTSSFPMVDMSRFDELVVGGKPFPNIYAYGSKIVDGDVINSIVDWLRPIIAGFIMICLMFFNYRKIYKLIRNSEPFGSIAQGSSDFRTGLTPSDPNPYGSLRDSLWEMRNEILRRERGK